MEALPLGLRQIANVLPTAHALQRPGTCFDGQGVPWGRLGLLLLGTVGALVVASWFGATMLKVFRSRGFVTRNS